MYVAIAIMSRKFLVWTNDPRTVNLASIWVYESFALCGLPGVDASGRSIGGASANENQWGVTEDIANGRVAMRLGSSLPCSVAGEDAFLIEGLTATGAGLEL